MNKTENQIALRDIKTTYRYKDMVFASVTLPDGRTFGIMGRRSRLGPRGRRYYVWSFSLKGPGLAHVAPHDQRDATWDGRVLDFGGPSYYSLDDVNARCSTLTSAKKYLAKLVALLPGS